MFCLPLSVSWTQVKLAEGESKGRIEKENYYYYYCYCYYYYSVTPKTYLSASGVQEAKSIDRDVDIFR